MMLHNENADDHDDDMDAVRRSSKADYRSNGGNETPPLEFNEDSQDNIELSEHQTEFNTPSTTWTTPITSVSAKVSPGF